MLEFILLKPTEITNKTKHDLISMIGEEIIILPHKMYFLCLTFNTREDNKPTEVVS